MCTSCIFKSIFLLFRPGSLIVEFKVGVEDSQLLQMIAGVRKMIKSSSKFDANYLAVQDLQGMVYIAITVT